MKLFKDTINSSERNTTCTTASLKPNNNNEDLYYLFQFIESLENLPVPEKNMYVEEGNFSWVPPGKIGVLRVPLYLE